MIVLDFTVITMNVNARSSLAHSEHMIRRVGYNRMVSGSTS